MVRSGAAVVGMVCPVCRTPLLPGGEVARCERCGQVYPSVSGILCLMPEPLRFVQTELRRIASYQELTNDRASALRREARQAGVPEKTRLRLERLATGLLAESECLEVLFEPLSDVALAHPASLDTLASLLDDPRLAARFWEHVFRDWVWGQAEHERTLTLVAQYLVEPTPTLAVFGAGTARLALDLSRHALVCEVIALDTNPLPFLVADRLLSGQAAELVEFPLVPLTLDDVAIPRRIEPPAIESSALHLVFADALRAPIADDSLDAVVTPWFIDAVAADLSETAAQVNRVLRLGGLWVNVGPLYYSGAPSHAYTLEEACDLVRDSGFELLDQQTHALRYFDSPVSGTCRIDRTYAFAARKVGAAPPGLTPPGTAPWLDDPRQPVPASAALAARVQRSVLTAGVGSLVDGTRSLTDISRALGQSWGVEPSSLLPMIRAFLSE